MRHCKKLTEISLHNWRQCNERGDLRFTRLGYELDDSAPLEEDAVAFNDLNSDLIDNYQGIPSTTVDLIELENKLLKSKLDFFLTKKPVHKNFIRIYENKIKNLREESGSGKSFDQLINMLEDWKKYHLDEHRMSAARFYEKVKEFKEYCAEVERKNKKNKVL